MQQRSRWWFLAAALFLAACAGATSPANTMLGVPSRINVPQLPGNGEDDSRIAAPNADEEEAPSEEDVEPYYQAGVEVSVSVTALFGSNNWGIARSIIQYENVNSYALNTSVQLTRETENLGSSATSTKAESWNTPVSWGLVQDSARKPNLIGCGLVAEAHATGGGKLRYWIPLVGYAVRDSAVDSDDDGAAQSPCEGSYEDEEEQDCPELGEEGCVGDDIWYICYFTIYFSGSSIWIEEHGCEEIEEPDNS